MKGKDINTHIRLSGTTWVAAGLMQAGPARVQMKQHSGDELLFGRCLTFAGSVSGCCSRGMCSKGDDRWSCGAGLVHRDWSEPWHPQYGDLVTTAGENRQAKLNKASRIMWLVCVVCAALVIFMHDTLCMLPVYADKYFMHNTLCMLPACGHKYCVHAETKQFSTLLL